MSASELTAAGLAPAATIHRGWIASPAYDLLLIVAAPLTGLATMLASQALPSGTLFIAALAYCVGLPHYLSSYVFFAGDDQRAYYLSRPVAYIGGPLAIFISVALLRTFGAFSVVLSVIYLWNIWHVAMQSSGVASLYRQLGGGTAAESRPAKVAIVATNAAMALFFADAFPPLATFTHRLSPQFWRFAAIVCGAVAVVALVFLGMAIARRTRRLSTAEMVSLGAALTLFHPFLWVRDLERATFGMLIGHFVQYLALVWLIQARKYGERHEGSLAQRATGWISRRPVVMLAVFVAIGAGAFVFSVAASRLGVPEMFIIALNALALSHFYLDGLIWAFRNPFVRTSLGPYVTVASHRAAA